MGVEGAEGGGGGEVIKLDGVVLAAGGHDGAGDGDGLDGGEMGRVRKKRV